MIGELVGPYRIVGELGRGGMGAVWLGEHAELGRRVAVKVLLPAASGDEQAVQRFFQEARAAARVRHPGIVQVFDVGRAGDGAPFLAMELLDGETLRARLRRGGPLGADEAATLARQIATTLHAAHEAGIVHRDLKPDNVMLVPDPEVPGGERAKVLDFGIAKLSEETSAATPQTRTGMLVGTPHYMSPEQCRGTGPIDGRSDVYALGCILFEMVCGQTPFQSSGVGELIGMHQYVPAPSPRGLRPDLPAWLEAVILRALVKDPERRWASCDAMAGALEAGGAGAAAAPPPVGALTGELDAALSPTLGTAIAPTPTTVALADTIATTPPPIVAVAEVHGAGDTEALAADAQRRATEMAHAIAREHGGGTGRGVRVIAVAVVVLAGLVLFVKFGRETAEPVRREQARAPMKEKSGGGAASAAHVPVLADKAGGGGRAAGSGTAAGSGAAAGTNGGRRPERQQPFLDAGPGELRIPTVAEARQALDDGDPGLARRLAGDVLALAPTDAEALWVHIAASCKLGDTALAVARWRELPEAMRGDLIARCAQSGVALPP